jgi:2-pyrone-4,6-dicarboxylate lactonase
LSSLQIPDANWIDWNKNSRAPKFVLPANSVDAHCHVFGPQAQFPFASERRYTPTDATFEDLVSLKVKLGIDRSVIVQASCHGTDNSALIDALSSSEGLARGVVSISPDINDSTLHYMNFVGVRGVRLNFISRLVSTNEDNYYLKIADIAKRMNWHLVVYIEASELAKRIKLLEQFESLVLFDHIGRPNISEGLEGEDFKFFLNALDRNLNFWVKISGPERMSTNGSSNFSDVTPFATHLATRFSDRVLWGTDWPHPNMKKSAPDDGDLIDWIPAFAPDEDIQRQILVKNPHNLYWAE